MLLRLSSFILITTLGFAHAADWQWLPGALERTSAGEQTAVPRIINGVPTTAYPAVAGLEIWTSTGSRLLCTGTLVSQSVVLTAAHCVEDDLVAIRTTFVPDGTIAEHYAVLAYAIHPEYRFPDADLAMLLLETPVGGIAPVPLAGRKPRPRTVGTIVGYGRDEAGTVGLKQMGSVRLRRCPRRVPALDLLPGQLARALCWRARSWEQNTCHGDSGGPLLVGGSLAGVTSGGEVGCTGFLSWDTSIVPFLPWIRGLLR